jgi:hypothetical protein
MLRYSVPPGYRPERPVKRPKLGPWVGVISAILEEDKNSPAKQRHTAKRIFDRLRQEYAYTGGYTIVKDYMRLHRVRTREMFVPRSHTPGLLALMCFGHNYAALRGLGVPRWSDSNQADTAGQENLKYLPIFMTGNGCAWRGRIFSYTHPGLTLSRAASS